MNPRYFIGIELPPDLSKTISVIQEDLYDPQSLSKPLVPHITLLHPKMLETLSPMYFVPKAKEIAAQILPINIKLTDIDVFHRRTLYISVESAALTLLYNKLIALLPDTIMAQYLGQVFSPHVTLAQSLGRMPLTTDIKDQFQKATSPLFPTIFDASYISQFVWVSKNEHKIKPIR